VLIKGGLYLERLAAVRAVAFDKTGTLTYGRPEVAEVIPAAGYSADDVLRLGAAVNRHSEHPLGRAIAREAEQRGVTAPPVLAFRVLPGLGAVAEVDGREVLVGSRRLMSERGVPLDGFAAMLAAAQMSGATPTLVACDGRPVGVIALADVPREAARDVVDLMRNAGVRHVEMLTGDGAGAAARIGAAVGVSAVRAELLPADKVAAVRDLQRDWRTVAMVGDGINDAPALAAADVGIVMGAAGSDAALETADVALMGDELARLPYALRLGRAAMRTIQVNIAIALAVKLAFLVLAVAGVTSLWLAILADTGTSLLVIANGLRLLGTR
jgi:Cd2+/Zn2+-exporting ATPase